MQYRFRFATCCVAVCAAFVMHHPAQAAPEMSVGVNYRHVSDGSFLAFPLSSDMGDIYTSEQGLALVTITNTGDQSFTLTDPNLISYTGTNADKFSTFTFETVGPDIAPGATGRFFISVYTTTPGPLVANGHITSTDPTHLDYTFVIHANAINGPKPELPDYLAYFPTNPLVKARTNSKGTTYKVKGAFELKNYSNFPGTVAPIPVRLRLSEDQFVHDSDTTVAIKYVKKPVSNLKPITVKFKFTTTQNPATMRLFAETDPGNLVPQIGTYANTAQTDFPIPF